MKLNPDCIRDILLTVEEFSAPGEPVAIPEKSQERMEKYPKDVVQYHVLQCEASHLICGVKPYSKGRYMVQDLTPTGHKFIENIRQDTIWNNTKSIAAKVGSKSLDAIMQIASNVITELIKSQFGLS